jgi:hypothetical protein
MVKQLKLFCKDQKVNLISLLVGILIYNTIKIDITITNGFPFPALLTVVVKILYLYFWYRVSYFYISKRIKG